MPARVVEAGLGKQSTKKLLRSLPWSEGARRDLRASAPPRDPPGSVRGAAVRKETPACRPYGFRPRFISMNWFQVVPLSRVAKPFSTQRPPPWVIS